MSRAGKLKELADRPEQRETMLDRMLRFSTSPRMYILPSGHLSWAKSPVSREAEVQAIMATSHEIIWSRFARPRRYYPSRMEAEQRVDGTWENEWWQEDPWLHDGGPDI